METLNFDNTFDFGLDLDCDTCDNFDDWECDTQETYIERQNADLRSPKDNREYDSVVTGLESANLL